MPRAIITKTQLPGVSEELTNKLRYRVVNRNRNLYSQWSVIGEIKRDREQTNFEEYTGSFTTDNSIPNLINIAWYTPDINQEFDIYVRYIYRQFSFLIGGDMYFYQPIQFLGRKNVNALSVGEQPPFPGRVFTSAFNNYGIQAMVKLPEYPRLNSIPINILTFERKANFYVYYLDRDPTFESGDYVNINLQNSSTVDNSQFAGIKKVSSIGPKTFFVASTGSDIAPRSAVGAGPENLNDVSKVNGIVQFVTDPVLFT